MAMLVITRGYIYIYNDRHDHLYLSDLQDGMGFGTSFSGGGPKAMGRPSHSWKNMETPTSIAG